MDLRSVSLVTRTILSSMSIHPRISLGSREHGYGMLGEEFHHDTNILDIVLGIMREQLCCVLQNEFKGRR